MDKAVKKLILTLACALSLANPAHAAPGLADPTRPPVGMDRATPSAAPGDGPRLQSVLISPRAGGRHVAVFDGDTVRLGDTWKGARVASMSRNQVVLQRGAERQVLRLDGAFDPVAGMTPASR